MTLRFAQLLERLAEVDECPEIEAKRCETELGKSALETISAFSNEPGMGGGYLVCGVEDGTLTGKVVVHGVADAKKLEQEISSVCASVFNRAVRPRVTVERHEGRAVVVAFIPEASPAEKPVFIANRGLQHGTFRRIGSSDQRCTEDDLRVLFRAGDTTPYETTVVPDAEDHELDEEVIAAYRRQVLEENPDSELRDATLLEIVQSMGGAVRSNGRLVPTVAGVMLFGSRLALRRLFPQHRVDYIRVPGTHWVPDADRRYDSIDVRAPLLLAFRRTYQAILDDLPKAFVLEPGQPERQHRPLVPASVIREALVNALCHRDYRIPSAIQVIRYSDRIEIRNPGHSLVAADRFGQPGSFPRNPRIADVFREMKLAENKGTGIDAMRRAMKHAELSPPVFESNTRDDRFVTTLWLHSLVDPAERGWLDGLGVELSHAQRQALVMAWRTGAVTNAGLRDLTGLDPLQARRELLRLRANGCLTLRGERGGAHYVLGIPGPTGAAASPDRGMAERDRGMAGRDRGMLAEPMRPNDVVDLGDASSTSGPDRGEFVPDRGMALERLPESLRLLVSGLGKRSRKHEVRAVIMRLCGWRALKAGELAAILGAHPNKLTERHLSPLVEDGALVRLFPDQPRHPDQAYRARQGALLPALDDDEDGEP